MTGSESVRWLFDLAEGGSPKAFMCLLKVDGTSCGCVTRTLVGMRTHQRIVHQFKAQKEMFDGKSDRHQLDGSHI